VLYVPTDDRDLVSFAKDMVEQCRVSVGMRTAYCRLMNAITETGRFDGTRSLINMLYMHLSRKAEHIFSPVELKFSLDFDREYPKSILDRAAVVAKQLTRHWDKTNADFLFGEGVFESLKYGACLFKQWAQVEGSNQTPNYYSKLVMPWQFGVYNESENELSRQPAMVETVSLTGPEVWRRICHLPDHKKLYDRIMANARSGNAVSTPQTFFHQILSTSQINTGVTQNTRPLPGGIVQLGNDPNYSIMGPQVAADMVEWHEAWVQDFDDYTTIHFVEPDVIVAPYGKKTNLLGIKNANPYTLIQMNSVTNWFWGRSELVDILAPQDLLATWLDDAKRLFGLQIDKFIAYVGEGGLSEEIYAAARMNGYMNAQQGSQVVDLTPKFPPEMQPMIEFLIKMINILSGFPEIMRGQGEQGVRSGEHASVLMKTASPQLRGEALKAERQCAVAADLTLQLKEAKDGSNYWTKADTLQDIEKTSFKIGDLPGDWRVTVDSHSSSPIFADENTQMIVGGHKMGIVGGEYVIDNLPFPDKDTAKAAYREKEKKQQEFMQKLMQQNPEVADKVLTKQLTGGGKR